MLRHVVCQKFADKADAIEAARMLRALPEQIPGLLSAEVGVNELPSERAFDLILIATFEDVDALHAYDAHPAHQACRAFIKPRRTATCSVDYTVE